MQEKYNQHDHPERYDGNSPQKAITEPIKVGRLKIGREETLHAGVSSGVARLYARGLRGAVPPVLATLVSPLLRWEHPVGLSP